MVLGLILAYLSPYFDPNDYWLFSMFGLFYPILLLANIVMVIFWMLFDFKYLFVSLVTIFLGWNHLQGFVNFTSPSADPADITVMSYNVSFFYQVMKGSKRNKEANKKDAREFFEKHKDVDVFCLQESAGVSRKILASVFPEYHLHEIRKRGTCIISKYPIKASGEIDFGTKTNSCLWADLQLPNEVVRVYSAHLQSNKVSKDAVEVIDNANIQEKRTWDGVKSILKKYRIASQRRAQQAQMISDHSANCEHRSIIAGDVNDPPTSYTYSRLCGDYQDAFAEAGSGIGTTYAGKIPMLRIDYILVDNDFEVEAFHVLKEPFSDHYPVKGVFSIVN